MDTVAMPDHVYDSLPLSEKQKLFQRYGCIAWTLDSGRLVWIQFREEVGHEVEDGY